MGFALADAVSVDVDSGDADSVDVDSVDADSVDADFVDAVAVWVCSVFSLWMGAIIPHPVIREKDSAADNSNFPTIPSRLPLAAERGIPFLSVPLSFLPVMLIGCSSIAILRFCVS